MADQLERQAEEIVPVDARPYTSCYEALHENQDLLERARSMQAMARGIREKFALFFIFFETSFLCKADI